MEQKLPNDKKQIQKYLLKNRPKKKMKGDEPKCREALGLHQRAMQENPALRNYEEVWNHLHTTDRTFEWGLTAFKRSVRAAKQVDRGGEPLTTSLAGRVAGSSIIKAEDC